MAKNLDDLASIHEIHKFVTNFINRDRSFYTNGYGITLMGRRGGHHVSSINFVSKSRFARRNWRNSIRVNIDPVHEFDT